jgi:hypothetical protein
MKQKPLEHLELELSVKDGKLTAKLDMPGIKLDLAIDAKAAGGRNAIWDQLSAVAFNLAQGCAQAGDMESRAVKRSSAKKQPRAKA